jgi:hypothetical protein
MKTPPPDPFKTHRQYYYELLNNVRLNGDWEAWLHFFVEAVVATAGRATDTSRQLIDLANEDRNRISGLGRAAASTLIVHRAMMERPITDSVWLVKKTGITPAAVNKCLGHLERLEIAKELTSRRRNRVFGFAGYLTILDRGTELPQREAIFSARMIVFLLPTFLKRSPSAPLKPDRHQPVWRYFLLSDRQ